MQLSYFLVFIFSLATLIKSSAIHNDKILSLNDLVDGALVKIRKILIRDGYEPMPTPNYEKSFLNVGLLGKLKLTDCRLHNLSTVYRTEDVAYKRDGMTFNVETVAAFYKLKLNCTYTASILGLLKKKGEAVVILPNLSAKVNMDFIVNKLVVHLNELHLFNNGLIDVHLEGGLLDGLASILTETVSNLFKNVILYQVEKQIKDKIQDILEKAMRTTRILSNHTKELTRNST